MKPVPFTSRVWLGWGPWCLQSMSDQEQVVVHFISQKLGRRKYGAH